ncbi:hypothetical protein RB200_24545 [Streptomyces sp. PmtG]
MSAIAALALALFLALTAVAHAVLPGSFRSLVPDWLPHPALLVAVSALAELAVAVSLCAPSTRAAGGWSAVALLAAFQVTHLDAARHTRTRSGPLHGPWGVAARLAVNAAYLAWAAAVATTA